MVSNKKFIKENENEEKEVKLEDVENELQIEESESDTQEEEELPKKSKEKIETKDVYMINLEEEKGQVRKIGSDVFNMMC